jgi:N-acetylmuramoyl-L-alanine amidase
MSLSYRIILDKQTYICLVLILLLQAQIRLLGQRVAPNKPFIVVIDPGHGGKDPGTVWKNIHEKDIALSIALKLGNYIKKMLPDVKVIYTRQTDVFIDLDKRAPIANKNQADLFISIHVNSNEKSTKPEGTETYFMGSTKSEENLEVATKENAVILMEDDYSTRYEGYNPNSPNSFILFSLLQNIHWKQSLRFADYVQNEVASLGKRTNRGVKQANFLVLWKTTVPSVLIETGFLSNEEDRKLLISEHGQETIASAIFRAFRNYKNGIESRSIYTNDKYEKDTLPLLTSSDTAAGQANNVADSKNDTGNRTGEKPQIDFLVQVTSSKKPIVLNSHHFKGLKDVEEIRAGENYKYAVGRKKSYKEAIEYCKIVKNYFPDAFVIALKDGKIISLKEAFKEIKD